MSGLIPETSPLHEVSQLEDNWDGENSRAPGPDLLETAQQLVDQLRLLFYDNQMPTICPTRRGGLAFLWIDAQDPSHELLVEMHDAIGWEMRLPDGRLAQGRCRTIQRVVAVAAYYLMQLEETEEKIRASLDA